MLMTRRLGRCRIAARPLVFRIAVLAGLLAQSAASLAQETAGETGPSQSADPWYAGAERALAERLERRPVEGRARNVILMIGSGAGVGAMTAIRIHSGQAAGGSGEDFETAVETLPHLALAKTYTVNAQTPDGAAAATALMTGVKTRSGTLGLDQSVRRGLCGSGARLDAIGDLFAADGRAVGFVSTARITHATPAAGYAASVERLWEHDAATPADCLQHDIALQLIERMIAGEVDLALGGGRARFFPEGTTDQEEEPGLRRDGRNLLAEAREAGVRTVWNAETLGQLDLTTGEPVLGLFAGDHMLYEHDRTVSGEDEPSLAQMTEAAIQALEASSGGAGYFLMIEGGRIGQASQYGNLHRMATDGAAFMAAVGRAAALTDPAETLLIVTADHEHSISFNGYCGRGSPVPGLCYEIDDAGESHGPNPALAADGKPYETATFMNGPNSAFEPDAAPAPRPALTPEEAAAPDRRQEALIPMAAETHSGEDVAVYARGPWAHLIDGVIEQNFVFHVMRHAAFAPAAPGRAGPEQDAPPPAAAETAPSEPGPTEPGPSGTAPN